VPSLTHLSSKFTSSAHVQRSTSPFHAWHSSQSVGAVFKNLTTDQIREFKIPLPPLATQKAIVAEIEAEQTLVNANRELISRMEKKIQATLARVWGEEVSSEIETKSSIEATG
jgi:hypothetical protein